MSTKPKVTKPPAASALVRHEKFFNRAARAESRVDPYKLDKDRLDLQKMLKTQRRILAMFEKSAEDDTIFKDAQERDKYLTWYQLLSTYLMPASILHISDYLCVQTQAPGKKTKKKRVVRVSIGESMMMINDLLEGWGAKNPEHSEEGVFGRMDTLMSMLNDVGTRWEAFRDEMGTPVPDKYFKAERNATIQAEEDEEGIDDEAGVSVEEIEEANKADDALKVPDLKKEKTDG
jgi:hypothetical protein